MLFAGEINMIENEPEAIELNKQQAVDLIATLAGQLAGVALKNRYNGATTSANLLSNGKRVVIYYKKEP